MKSISIAFNAPSITIPIGYHHQVQGLIYKLLRCGGEEDLHDEGADFGLRQYKLFTFSSLRGGKIFPGSKSIRFEHTAYLDVRSVRTEFCDALIAGLESGCDMDLFGHPLSIQSVKSTQPVIADSRLRIKMLSPLTIHKTEEQGYTNYLTPLDLSFAEAMNANFARKYDAFTGQEPMSDIQIKVRAIGAQDRYLTRYKRGMTSKEKDIYITGWRGEYELRGAPEYLNFLYYCGLGARNSDGFGMFEII